jgi:hypothetical protein
MKTNRVRQALTGYGFSELRLTGHRTDHFEYGSAASTPTKPPESMQKPTESLRRAESPHCQNTNWTGKRSRRRKLLRNVHGHIKDIRRATVERSKLRCRRRTVSPNGIDPANAFSVGDAFATISQVQSAHPLADAQRSAPAAA